MPLNYTALISGNQCIGDSRYTINSNFSSLDTSVYFLSTGFNQLTSYKVSTVEPLVSIVRANSASWEESAEILPTVTNYLSTNLVAMSSIRASGPFVIDTNSVSAALRVTQTGTGDALVVEDSANPDSTAFVVTSAGNLVIGSLPSNPLHYTGLGLNKITVVDENNNGWRYEQYNSQDGTNFRNYRARGTIASPLNVFTTDRLASFFAGGYGISTWSNPNGGIAIYAAENFTDTSCGTFVTIGTSLTGTNPGGGGSERLRVTHDGKVGIGTTAPNELLTVAGNINAQNLQVTNVSAVNLIGVPLSSLRDVVLTTPVSAGSVLRHNGTNWYNEKGTTDVINGVRNDISVTDAGVTWTIVPEAVTFNKLSNTISPLTANVRSRVADAWLNYNGVANTIRSSYNVSSVTDQGTGYYRINYVTGTFIDSNYSFVATCDETASGGVIGYYVWSQPLNFNTNYTDVKHHSYSAGSTETDPNTLSIVVFASGN